MAIVLEAFPKLSREILVKIGCSSGIYKFFYRYQGENRELQVNTADTSTSRAAVLQLTDPACHWHPETSNLIANLYLSINVPAFLFGETGLAAKNGGELGIAVLWMLPEANQRGSTVVGSINSKSPGPFELSGEVCFQAQTLRGTLILKTVLFLKNRGIPTGSEIYQADKVGTIVGVLDETRVIIDGNGSMFPIHEVSSPNEPLWWVRCDWEDPLEDSFTEDNFCIYLNKAHKDYASLNVNEGLKNSPLLFEIICSSLQTLLTKVLNDDSARDATIQGAGIQQGSISSMVNYFLHTFSVSYDRNSPEALAVEIRKKMMKMV